MSATNIGLTFCLQQALYLTIDGADMTISIVTGGVTTDLGVADTAAPFANVSPALPTGHVTNDLLLLGAGVKDFATTMQCNAFIATSTITNGTTGQGLDVGSMRCSAWYKVDDGAEAAPGIIYSAAYNPTMAWILGLHSTVVADTWVVTNTTATDADAASTTFSATGAATLGFNTGDWVVVFAACKTDGAAMTSGAITATGATFGSLTEQISDNISTIGNDGAFYCWTGEVSAGPATAAPVFTATMASGLSDGSCIILRIQEPVLGAPLGSSNMVTKQAINRASFW